MEPTCICPTISCQNGCCEKGLLHQFVQGMLKHCIRTLQCCIITPFQFDRHKILIVHQQSHSFREITKQPEYWRCGIQALIKKSDESGQEWSCTTKDYEILWEVWYFFSLKGLKKSSKDPTQHLAASLKCPVDRNRLCVTVDMPNITKIRMKSSGKECYRLTNPSLNILGPVAGNMWEEELERDGEVNASVKHGGGLHFCQRCWQYGPNWWDPECWRVQIGFSSPVHSFWKMSDGECFEFVFFFISMITIDK